MRIKRCRRRAQPREPHPSRSLWKQLHDALVRSVTLDDAWQQLRRRHPALAAFDDPLALIATLRGEGGDRDYKDRIYRNLLAALRRDDATSRLARDLVCLGLWRGITVLVRRHRALAPDAEDVASDVATVCLTLLYEIDTRAVRRLAPTIVLNTGRLLTAQRLRAWSVERRARTVLDLASLVDTPATPTRANMDALNGILVERVGADGTLLLVWAVGGLTYAEIAKRLRVSLTTVRRRVGRARAELRRQLLIEERNEKSEKTLNTIFEPDRDVIGVAHSLRSLVDTHRCPNHWPPSSRPGATVRVGTTLYCAPCAEFLLKGLVRHERDLSCVVTGGEGPAICPACLVDVFRTRGGAL
jgi:DNA-directed RNA polymerase specialized sigma24 family protein